MPQKHTFKIVLIGDGGVGKTSLRNQYIHHRFAATYKATIGADFLSTEVEGADGRKVLLQVWDTAGQERFASLGKAFYRGADVCVLVYSVASYASFASLDRWRKDFLLHASPADPSAFPFIVVGNKTDLGEERVVTRRQAQDWAARTHRGLDEWDRQGIEVMPCLETSAKEGVGVEDVFSAVAQRVRIPQLTIDMYGDGEESMGDGEGMWMFGEGNDSSASSTLRIRRRRTRSRRIRVGRRESDRNGRCCW